MDQKNSNKVQNEITLNSTLNSKLKSFCDLTINISTALGIIISVLEKNKVDSKNHYFLFLSEFFNQKQVIAYGIVIGLLTMSSLVNYFLKNHYAFTLSNLVNKLVNKYDKNKECTLRIITIFFLIFMLALFVIFICGLVASNTLFVLFSSSIFVMLSFWISISDSIILKNMRNNFGLIITFLIILVTILADDNIFFGLLVAFGISLFSYSFFYFIKGCFNFIQKIASNDFKLTFLSFSHKFLQKLLKKFPKKK